MYEYECVKAGRVICTIPARNKADARRRCNEMYGIDPAYVRKV